jgi:predicted transcriptional regulator
MKQVPAIIIALLLFAPCASAASSDIFSHNSANVKDLVILGHDAAKDAENDATELAENAKNDAVSTTAKAESLVKVAANKVLDIFNWILGLFFGKNVAGGADGEEGQFSVSAFVAKPIVKKSLIAVFVLASMFATVAAIAAKLCFVPLRCKSSANDQTLDNPARRKIFEMIKSKPGVRITEIANEAGVGWGAALYHISVLEKKGYITSNAKAHNHSFFENNGKYTREERIARTILRVGKSAVVLEHIKANPGSSTSAISSALGISGSITSWYTKNLCEYGLIRKARNGKSMAHYVIENFAAGGASVH